MTEQLTNGAGTKDWLNATKGLKISAYDPSWVIPGKPEQPSTGQKRSVPVGRNIREAIQSIKGDKG